MSEQIDIARRPDRWSRDEGGIDLVRPERPPCPARLDAQPDPIRIDMARMALMVVDMQNDFLAPEGWFATVRGAEVAPLHGVIPNINSLAAAFRCAGAPVIHLNWGVRGDLANLPPNVVDKGSACGAVPGYGARIASGDVLVRGSWGAASHDAISRGNGDIEVAKHRLSGFRDNELDQILRRRGVTVVFYTGVNLDRCVFATLMDGCFQGYDAVLVEDASTTVSPPHVSDAILYLVRLLYGFTTTTAAVLSALDRSDEQGERS